MKKRSLELSLKPLIGQALSFLAATVALGFLASAPACAGTYTVLYGFTGGTDGSSPIGGVVEDATGTLYGATDNGGGMTCTARTGQPRFGCGTVFSFSTAGGLKTLVSFTGPNGAYGGNALMLNGTTLYGSTLGGGASGDGVLFSVSTGGANFTLLHQFIGSDGSVPDGTLRMGAGHILYGITASGGPGTGNGHGVLFQLAPDGTYTILHAFTGGADGGDPVTLLIDSLGRLLGSAYNGGIHAPPCPSEGCGLVFAYVPATGKFTVLHSFSNANGDGGSPYLGSLGKGPAVYGVGGSLFSLRMGVGYTSLASFGLFDGGTPNSGPTLAPNGSLIGVNSTGPTGINGAGTLYSENGGVITDLYYFSGRSDGGYPAGQPLLTPSGSIIGTTELDGPNCTYCGVIYEYTP